jgi:DNA-directed RNA polymerase specialized sigma24 family protein
VTTNVLTLTRPRRRATDRRGTRAIRDPRSAVSAAGRERVAAALARRGTRERLVLTLLLYERLFPLEVANALGLSLRQVERTYDALIAELRRSLPRAATRARSRAGVAPSRQRKAA